MAGGHEAVSSVRWRLLPRANMRPSACISLGAPSKSCPGARFSSRIARRPWMPSTGCLPPFPKHGWADDSLYRKGMILHGAGQGFCAGGRDFQSAHRQLSKGGSGSGSPQAVGGAAGTDKNSVPAARSAEVKTPGADAAKPVAKDEPKPQPPAAIAPAPSVKADTGLTLLGIRHWSSSDYTRVVMDLTHDVKYERALVEKTTNGNKQLQITLQKTGIAEGVMPERTIQDGILSQIRVGADSSGGALVTFDLMQMDSYRVFTLPDPYRVVLDIYGAAGGKVVQASTVPVPTPASVPSPAASPSQTPVASAKSAPTIAAEDKDHVLAALAELQAKQALSPPRKRTRRKNSTPRLRQARRRCRTGSRCAEGSP
jgi:N-acetylmuramoyl-L-alanine amidase